MSEFERLQTYSTDFSEATLTTVSEAAEPLRSLKSWPDIQNHLLEDHVELIKYEPPFGRAISVFDFVPDEYDTTLLYHLPMGNSLDPNMQTRLAALGSVLGTARLIAMGNPSVPFSNSGLLTASERKQVAKGDFRPTVSPVLQYINQQKVDSIIQAGASYGADKAALSAGYSDSYDIATTHAVLLDPASAVRRPLHGLLQAFQSTEEHLDTYVSATDWEGYNDARNEASGMLQYVLGLMRPSNIAIGMGIAKGRMLEHATVSLAQSEDRSMHFVWGTESELATNQVMIACVDTLREQFGQERISGHAVDGQHHAMMDDLFLHSALVLEGIARHTQK